jgi:ribose transport system permease protein
VISAVKPVLITAQGSDRTSPFRFLRRFGPLLGLMILCAVFSVLSAPFRTFDNVLNVLRQSAVGALLALGQMVVMLTAGIDLSIGSILGLCCVLAALLLKAGAPAAVSILGASMAGAGLGAVNGLLLTKLRLPHPFIPTLGMMNVARGLALIMAGGLPISELPDGFRVWGAGSLASIPVPAILVALSYFLCHAFLTRTTPGRDLYAVGGNVRAARLSGVPVEARLILAYGISGLAAALGAIVLAGRMNSGFPLAGSGAELDSVAAVVLGGGSFFGGAGSAAGTLAGALIMAILRNGLNLLSVSAYWQTIVIGVAIVVTVWIDVMRQRAAAR